MAILRYISATSATTPLSPDSPKPPPSIPNLRQTKVTLPKKNPEKLPTSVAQTATKPRKDWLGQGVEPWDSDDLIWNKDFVPRMKRLFDDSDALSLNFPSAQEEDSGFLSLSRAMDLDSMEVDLSKELTAPLQSTMEIQVEAPTESSGVKTQWRPSPTRREQDKWDRARKAATRGSEVMIREVRQSRGDPEVLAAQAREQYIKLKKKLQVLTWAVGGVGLVSSYVSYSPEVAASFGAGFLGSLMYIRMLGSSVDAMADGARGLLKGAIGQPRILVPVVLVMIYNRWNGILVPEYGFMHLELIPMLVGFFTYKIATFIQTVEEALTFDVKKEEDASLS